MAARETLDISEVAGMNNEKKVNAFNALKNISKMNLTLHQVMTWRQTGCMPLSEPVMKKIKGAKWCH